MPQQMLGRQIFCPRQRSASNRVRIFAPTNARKANALPQQKLGRRPSKRSEGPITLPSNRSDLDPSQCSKGIGLTPQRTLGRRTQQTLERIIVIANRNANQPKREPIDDTNPWMSSNCSDTDPSHHSKVSDSRRLLESGADICPSNRSEGDPSNARKVY